MRRLLEKLLSSPQPEVPAPRVPDGTRWYVVGDIHGRGDLFDALISAIEADDAAAPGAATTVVLLGDLIDRGPESAGVVAVARAWQIRRRVRLLAGNHEEMFLDSFSDTGVLRHFLTYGGRETLLSYHFDRKRLDALDPEAIQREMAALVPEADRAFLAGAEDWIEAGDYLLVHAGIAPDVPLEAQKRSDLLWIRGPFLSHREPFSHVVVHGHTIFEEVEDTGTRIGIDTGAYCNGRLTALVLEGSERRLLQAVERGGAITIEHSG